MRHFVLNHWQLCVAVFSVFAAVFVVAAVIAIRVAVKWITWDNINLVDSECPQFAVADFSDLGIPPDAPELSGSAGAS